MSHSVVVREPRNVRTTALWTLVIAGLTLFLAACGGGSSPATSTTTSTPAGPGMTATRVMLGDGPSDTIASFEITINSIVLNSSSGQVTVLSKPQRLEISRLSEDMEPLVVLNVPAGTYTSATVSVSNPEVTVIDPVTKKPVELAVALSSATVTVNFSSPIAISGSATSLNFDLDLQNSVTVSGGSATVAPVFTVTQVQIRAGETEKEEDGAIDEFTGIITAISGTTLTVQNHAGMSLTFNTDANTKFDDISGFSALKVGMLVEVKASSQADGSFLAAAIEAKVEIGDMEEQMELEGLVTQTTGTPVTTFQLLTRQAAMAAGTPPAVGQGIGVNVTSSTVFRIPKRGFDLTNLPFTPAFDASHLIAGQSVEVDSPTPATTSVNAGRVALHAQMVKGTVSNLTSTGSNSSTFTLTVPADSVFATLTGSTTLTVFKQPGTDLRNSITINNGDTVRVRGLLFLDGASLKLVARRIGKP